MKIFKGNILRTQCGSPVYIAPEIIGLAKTYKGPPVDIFSSGVLLFMMHTGTEPFN
jgi:serine/threonine protein kinase